MIGSGYSLNAKAKTKGTSRFPLWEELTNILAAELYPANAKARQNAVASAGSSSGALRLAEEFESAFGRNKLNQLLEDAIPNNLHEPADVHTQLLELPWVDVYTTNYDTLLERAASKIFQRNYMVVAQTQELPGSRRPRIIKLHGCFERRQKYVITEEDFRRYANESAAFVNEFRVSLIENVFCLFGFSGDDPNFLQWTGWVRDQLGKDAPYLYWFHFKNDLQTFQTRLLEDRRIIPIGMKELFPEFENDYSSAFLALFDQLHDESDEDGPTWNRRPLIDYKESKLSKRFRTNERTNQ